MIPCETEGCEREAFVVNVAVRVGESFFPVTLCRKCYTELRLKGQKEHKIPTSTVMKRAGFLADYTARIENKDPWVDNGLTKSDAVAIVKDMLKRARDRHIQPFYYLWGKEGRGKTELAHRAVYAMLSAFPHMKAVYAQDRVWRDGYNDSAQSARSKMNPMKEADVVVVDEFGKSPTYFGFSLWHQLLDVWRAKGSLVIVCSNHSPDSLTDIERRKSEDGSKPCASRLLSKSSEIIHLDGIDMRKR